MPNDVLYALIQRHRVFDGTNAPDMLAAMNLSGFPDAYISASASYPGASATLQIMTDTNPNNGPYPVNFTVGSSWSFAVGGMIPEQYLTDNSFVVPLADFIRDHAPQPALAVGYEITPSLGPGASATVSVPMVPDLPDAGYNVAVALAGSTQLLGSLQILGHTVVSASAVNVSVQNNNGLLTLAGATVLVTALHNG